MVGEGTFLKVNTKVLASPPVLQSTEPHFGLSQRGYIGFPHS